MNRVSRRSFVKGAVVTAAGASLLQHHAVLASPVRTAVLGNDFIRFRRGMKGKGWDYIRVKTVAKNYPRTEDEKDFVPGKFGGDTSSTYQASGKFRTEKINNRWHLIDPDGHPFISRGLNCIRPGMSDEIKETVVKMGGADKWAKSAVDVVKQAGFNTAGYWSTVHFDNAAQNRHDGIPYVYYGFAEDNDPLVNGYRAYGLMQNFMGSLGTTLDVNHFESLWPAFHPEFKAFCESRCERLQQVKDDPWMVGYFTDNELRMPTLEDCLEKQPTDPIYGPTAKEARRWLESNYADQKLTAAIRVAWVAHALDWYLQCTTQAIRKYDKNHLILGSRMFGWERNHPEVFAVAGKHLDVVTLNPYGMVYPKKRTLMDWSKWAGDKPILIGEFYIKGMEADVESTTGAGFVVVNQAERGRFYQHYAIELLESGVCVGWHWHQYADGIRVNSGILNKYLKPYSELYELCSELNHRAHHIAARGA